jgi:ribulose-5-phosphate 4-epimerase/fuculose-1-phosphate aldolase
VSDFAPAIRDLVTANRILAREDVLDAYGHVSVRHPLRPERFLLASSRSPEMVEYSDILEFDLHGEPVDAGGRKLYIERFIHAAIFEARPDVNAVVHSHAEDVVPFSIAPVPLQPVIHNASRIGTHVPVWDIRDNFGDTNMLVSNVEQGRDLARTLAGASVVLMRGHGFAAVGSALINAVGLSVYLPKNARILLHALRLGEVNPLSAGEVEQITSGPQAHDMKRAWEYWSQRAGCAGPPKT